MEPPENLGYMRSHYTAVGVDFIDDYDVQSG